MIGSASRTAFCVFVSSLRGTGCAALRDNEYLDGELHGDDGLFVVGLGVEGLLGQFFGRCTELCVEIDR